MLCAKQLDGLDDDEVARSHLGLCLARMEGDECPFTDEEERALRRIDAKLRIGGVLEDDECAILFDIYLSIAGF